MAASDPLASRLTTRLAAPGESDGDARCQGEPAQGQMGRDGQRLREEPLRTKLAGWVTELRIGGRRHSPMIARPAGNRDWRAGSPWGAGWPARPEVGAARIRR